LQLELQITAEGCHPSYSVNFNRIQIDFVPGIVDLGTAAIGTAASPVHY